MDFFFYVSFKNVYSFPLYETFDLEESKLEILPDRYGLFLNFNRLTDVHTNTVNLIFR